MLGQATSRTSQGATISEMKDCQNVGLYGAAAFLQGPPYNLERMSPWRNWIARRPPKPKVSGSNPLGDTLAAKQLTTFCLLDFFRCALNYALNQEASRPL